MDAAPVIARGHSVAAFVPPVTEAALPYIQAADKRPTLVLTPDADCAAQLADALPGAFAVTALARAQHRLASTAPDVVVAGVPEALALLRRSALHPGGFASVVLAWPEQLDEEGAAALESIMAECDKDTQRLILTAQTGKATDRFVERYAFKAMTFGFPPQEREGWTPPAPVGPARYVVARASQLAELRRRILDAVNPERDEDVVVAPCPASREAAAELAARAPVGVGPVIVAEAQQVGWLRSLFAPLTALRLPGASDLAEQRAEKLRARLVRTIETGNLDRELSVVGPLLEGFDPALIAAAALRLAGEGHEGPGGAATPAPAMPGIAKIWVGIGRKDNVKPGDLVGAMVNEAKVPADAIGRIEVRDLFCLVEVRSDVADKAVQGLTGATVRGRRLIARVDRGPGTGSKPPRRG